LLQIQCYLALIFVILRKLAKILEITKIKNKKETLKRRNKVLPSKSIKVKSFCDFCDFKRFLT
jgi:hypothetical protein